MPAASYPHRDALLLNQLRTLFPEVPPATIEFMQRHLRWVEIAAGETLIEQGAIGDSAYLTISGRLRVYVTAEGSPPRMVRELSRGEVIGEMSLYTGEPRSATVVAVRDSVLVRLAKEHFEALLISHPQVSLTFTRQMIRRLQTEHERHSVAAPVTVGLLPVSAGVDLDDFAQHLMKQLQCFGRVTSMSAAAMDSALDDAGISVREDADADHRISLALDALEAQHDFVLLIGDATPNAWTRRCIRNSDEMLLVADATQPPIVNPIETICLDGLPARSEAAEILVLLHPADTVSPKGARTWLARRQVTGHVNLRLGLERDMARLARLLSRTAVGLVLAGGGARGFAHLGIWRALNERGVEIDVVGGTSIGAIMAALIAFDPPIERAIDIARRAFGTNPTGDFNLLPLVSLIKGGGCARQCTTRSTNWPEARSTSRICGRDSSASPATTHRRGNSASFGGRPGARRCSPAVRIPGALPPVVRDGDLLCDGGTFNNFPVDAMRELRGVGKVIGVDLGVRSARRLEIDDVPGSWSLLFDRLRPRAQAPLPAAIAHCLSAEHHDSLQHVAAARSPAAGGPLLQPAAVQGRPAAVVALRRNRAAGVRVRRRSDRRIA